jgi:hypothetical protein
MYRHDAGSRHFRNVENPLSFGEIKGDVGWHSV